MTSIPKAREQDRVRNLQRGATQPNRTDDGPASDLGPNPDRRGPTAEGFAPGDLINHFLEPEQLLPYPATILPFPSEAANHIAQFLLPPGSLPPPSNLGMPPPTNPGNPSTAENSGNPATVSITVPARPAETITIPINLPPHVPSDPVLPVQEPPIQVDNSPETAQGGAIHFFIHFRDLWDWGS